MEHSFGNKNGGATVPEKHTGLLLLAKEGDESAFGELVREYTPLLDSAVNRYRGGLSEQDVEELRQEALVAFHRAVVSFEVLYGNVSFGLYAKICVSKAIISSLRQLRKSEGVEFVSLDEVELSELGGSDDPVSAVIERENAAALRRFIRENLSKYENSVWWMYYSGMSIDDIAESLQTSKKSVGNALSRIRQKLRRLLSQ